jgi:DNA-binding CsgD family transcriptional regulator
VNPAVVATLDRIPMALVVTASGGRPVAVNRAARALLSQADGLSLIDGALRAWDAGGQRLLRALLEDEGDDGGMLRLRRPSGRSDYEVRVTLVRPLGAESEDHALKAVFLSDPERALPIDFGTAVRLYRLTLPEAALATELAQGKSLGQAAAELKTTIDTARLHLNQVFQKTGTRRQGELVWLFLTGPGAAPAD